ncbi:MAG: cephalosporin-C deacetylase [Cryptosporangiaceae bacterium]|nr:cephalosporin-C deacetylase [Cryptosporangiaceae bacterium]
MPHTDLPEADLREYRTSVQAPADLAAFWSQTLGEARALAVPPVLDPVHTGLRLVTTQDVTFSGFGGHPIRAWYHRPAGALSELPTVIVYHGYSGGRPLPHCVPAWCLAGYAVLDVDTRGQGGDTADPGGSGPFWPGYLTRGIEDPHSYYYRRVFTDAVLAVDAARALPGVDPSRIAVTGESQGGGMTIAVAALAEGITAAMPDVPFLSDLPRAASIATRTPYSELVKYLSIHRSQVERAFATLAYFDVAVLASLATVPALFSVGLMDQTTPPSTVYAAYNAYAGDKELRTYPFNEHEGGHSHHEAEQLHWLSAALPLP